MREPASVDRNFILQQGFDDPDPASCSPLASALLVQPRVVGLLALVAALLRSSGLFAALALILLWSAILPEWNPFDALYNRLGARRAGFRRLTAAPAPRRFAQGMAATFATAIAFALRVGAARTALGIEILFFVAIAAIALGRFCLGSFVFQLARGRVSFALRTLPWRRSG
ncbi:MAG TPA: DUF4395 family protein [Gemmatimonadaceae bacterium]|jgi:uncharacterized protein DUF4395|nr:DUF4395 family protein [Gemmatimonadaceae bacterium]